MIKEFKEFAMKGNMLDMAIGIVLGAAFGTVMKSFVADLIMPVVSSVFGTPDFSNLFDNEPNKGVWLKSEKKRTFLDI